MSELSMRELEAQTGEVLPEREALSAYFVFGPHNRITQVSHTTTVNATNSLDRRVERCPSARPPPRPTRASS